MGEHIEMFKKIYLEISGICNGKCPWCYTGIRNRRKSSSSGGFIRPGDFARAIEYMLKRGIIGQDTLIILHNWGEPFLNPSIKDIVRFLHESHLSFGLSTNASRLVEFEGSDLMDGLKLFRFSMPGFSQSSYDKIHGFDFDAIKGNIPRIISNLRECGFHGEAQIAYHIYQFNRDELEPACEFASELGINLLAYYAYLADFDDCINYLSGNMPRAEQERASMELVLSHVKELVAQMPPDYHCPQHDILVLDENYNLLPCCIVGTDVEKYGLGNLFDLSLDEIRKLKTYQPYCKSCLSSGACYLVHNPIVVKRTDNKLAVS
ncbi:hypothetical protein J7M28_03525 [bacterium]|nr:hypothetical protein [bacterium]